jgi:hypothetical protein
MNTVGRKYDDRETVSYVAHKFDEVRTSHYMFAVVIGRIGPHQRLCSRLLGDSTLRARQQSTQHRCWSDVEDMSAHGCSDR